MTIITAQDAADVLNERKHRGFSTWFAYVTIEHPAIVTTLEGGFDGDRFTEFEAVAIAEKYVREVPGLVPSPPPYLRLKLADMIKAAEEFNRDAGANADGSI